MRRRRRDYLREKGGERSPAAQGLLKLGKDFRCEGKELKKGGEKRKKRGKTKKMNQKTSKKGETEPAERACREGKGEGGRLLENLQAARGKEKGTRGILWQIWAMLQ